MIGSTYSRKVISENTLGKLLTKGKWLEGLLKDYKLPETILTGKTHRQPKVLLYGSSINGTSLVAGDADYTILFPVDGKESESGTTRIDSCLYTVEREKQEMVLSDVYKHIKTRTDDATTLKTQRIFRARVPIVACKQVSADEDFKFDLSLSVDGVRNSFLLRQYTKGDPRLRLGILAAKQWGREQKILDARRGWISPYALSIMYIYFMKETGRLNNFLDEREADEALAKLIASNDSTPEEYCGFYPIDVEAGSEVEKDIYDFFNFFGGGSAFDFDNDVVDIRVNANIKKKEEWLRSIESLDDTQNGIC
ncbi:RNA polymerase II [Angomonas deanei]|nr:RNA polymerase II [Angomonas deanei]|eukprot:EPY42835.1 RNA polymerase II [Angomonas deanei]